MKSIFTLFLLMIFVSGCSHSDNSRNELSGQGASGGIDPFTD